MEVILTVVVNGGEDRDGLLGDIDTGEDSSGLRNTRESFMKNLGGEMAELQEDVVLLGTDATTLSDLDGHRA